MPDASDTGVPLVQRSAGTGVNDAEPVPADRCTSGTPVPDASGMYSNQDFGVPSHGVSDAVPVPADRMYSNQEFDLPCPGILQVSFDKLAYI